MIEGSAYKNVNLRSSPNTTSSANLAGVLYDKQIFVGSDLVADSKGRGQWIKLTSINGASVVGVKYVAGWVVNYNVIPDVPVPPAEDLGVPVQVKLIETFGSGSTRTTTWENPTVLE